MGIDKPINHYREDVEGMAEVKTVASMLDIVPLLDQVYVKQQLWFEFVSKCKRRGIDIEQYLSEALKDEIENALKYDLV